MDAQVTAGGGDEGRGGNAARESQERTQSRNAKDTTTLSADDCPNSRGSRYTREIRLSPTENPENANTQQNLKQVRAKVTQRQGSEPKNRDRHCKPCNDAKRTQAGRHSRRPMYKS